MMTRKVMRVSRCSGLLPRLSGTNYLGSESGYSTDPGNPEHLFGSSAGTFYEADRGGAFDFTYVYGPTPDNFTLERLTDNGRQNWEAAINNNGDMVWEGAYGDNNDYSDIYLRHNGVVTVLPSPSTMNWAPDINDAGQVVWGGYNQTDGTHHIYYYDIYGSGGTIDISGPYADSSLPKINNPGQVVWSFWDGSDYEIRLVQPGLFTQITDNTSRITARNQ